MIQILNSHTDRIMSIKLKLNDTNTIIMACSGCVQPNSKSLKCISMQHACWMDIYIYLYLFYFFSSLWLIRNYSLSPFCFYPHFFIYFVSFAVLWNVIKNTKHLIGSAMGFGQRTQAALYLVQGQNKFKKMIRKKIV